MIPLRRVALPACGCMLLVAALVVVGPQRMSLLSPAAVTLARLQALSQQMPDMSESKEATRFREAMEAGENALKTVALAGSHGAPAHSAKTLRPYLNAYFHSINAAPRSRARRSRGREVNQLRREVNTLKGELATSVVREAEQQASLRTDVGKFGHEIAIALRLMLQMKAHGENSRKGSRIPCECTTAECNECPNHDYDARASARQDVGDTAAKMGGKEKAEEEKLAKKLEAVTETKIHALRQRLAKLQLLAGGEQPSGHYYVTGEYGKDYNVVYNKLFAPGDPTPIHARGGLFENVDSSDPLPGKRMITRIHKIQLSGNITCNNCFFLGQNSKVTINNMKENVTESGEEDSDLHSIFDNSESLRTREQQKLRQHTHKIRLQRARALRARKAALKKNSVTGKASVAADRVMAAAEVEARKSLGDDEGVQKKKESKLERVEQKNSVLMRAEKAIAKSNSILKERLEALKETQKMFQKLRSPKV